MHHTTLNIHKRIKRRIKKLSVKRGMTQSDIVILLLKYYQTNECKICDLKNSVKYQKKGKKKYWKRFHIVLTDQEYEFFTDMRKLSKKSVSLILALSLSKYYNFIYEELKSKSLESFVREYCFETRKNNLSIKDGILLWAIKWEFN